MIDCRRPATRAYEASDRTRTRVVMMACLLALIPPEIRAEPSVTTVAIAIERRIFDPSFVTVRSGEPVRLEFQNFDSELHAVIPEHWLKGVNVAVSGNGAPEFTGSGLHRVVIPSGGHAELQFTLSRPGIYRYRCDMPGHEMQATIEVRE